MSLTKSVEKMQKAHEKLTISNAKELDVFIKQQNKDLLAKEKELEKRERESMNALDKEVEKLTKEENKKQ